jgi:hypothetical protein
MTKKITENYNIADEKDFKLDAEISSDRIVLIKESNGKIENIGLDVRTLERLLDKAKHIAEIESEVILDKRQYVEPIFGYSMFGGDKVKVWGEQRVQRGDKVFDQYIYDIVGHEPQNGLPFVSLKGNIILDN